MKKVLIALNYEPGAQQIAEEGFALARSMAAEIALLHVIADPVFYSSMAYSPIMGFSGYMDMEPAEPGIEARLLKASADFLEKTKAHLGDKSISILVKEGEVAQTVLETAKDIQANIIVLGHQGRKWLSEVVTANVTGEILHQSAIPLYIIPSRKITAKE